MTAMTMVPRDVNRRAASLRYRAAVATSPWRYCCRPAENAWAAVTQGVSNQANRRSASWSSCDGDTLAQVVASTLGVAQRAGRSLEQSIAEFLRPARLLLVLDNCEHLLDASGRLAAAILAGCPGVRVLATSREALAVPTRIRRTSPRWPAGSGGVRPRCAAPR
jgi:hypothetical protein